MWGSAAQPHLRDSLWRSYDGGAPETADPVVAVAHQVALAMMNIAGPFFWAALAAGFVAGALGISGWR